MRIGIVTPYAPPEKGAASTRMFSLANYLNSKRYKTILIAPFRKKSAKNIWIKRYGGFFDLTKLIKKQDIILVTVPPIKTAFKLLPFMILFRKSYVLDIRDISYRGKWRWLKKMMEKMCAKFAKKITVVTEHIKRDLYKNYKIPLKKITVIPNGADSNIFYKDNLQRIKIRNELGFPKNSKVLFYEGIIGDHELDSFIDTIDINLLKKYNIYLLFVLIVGETENESKKLLRNLKNKINKKNIENRVRFIINISLNELYKYFSAADFALNPIPSTKDNLYRITVKTFEYMACELPIISKGPRGGELDKFTKKYNCGLFITSWRKFNSKLKAFMRRYKFFERNGNRSRKIIKNIFDKKFINARFEKVIRSLKKDES